MLGTALLTASYPGAAHHCWGCIHATRRHDGHMEPAPALTCPVSLCCQCIPAPLQGMMCARTVHIRLVFLSKPSSFTTPDTNCSHSNAIVRHLIVWVLCIEMPHTSVYKQMLYIWCFWPQRLWPLQRECTLCWTEKEGVAKHVTLYTHCGVGEILC